MAFFTSNYSPAFEAHLFFCSSKIVWSNIKKAIATSLLNYSHTLNFFYSIVHPNTIFIFIFIFKSVDSFSNFFCIIIIILIIFLTCSIRSIFFQIINRFSCIYHVLSFKVHLFYSINLHSSLIFTLFVSLMFKCVFLNFIHFASKVFRFIYTYFEYLISFSYVYLFH